MRDFLEPLAPSRCFREDVLFIVAWYIVVKTLFDPGLLELFVCFFVCFDSVSIAAVVLDDWLKKRSAKRKCKDRSGFSVAIVATISATSLEVEIEILSTSAFFCHKLFSLSDFFSRYLNRNGEFSFMFPV